MARKTAGTWLPPMILRAGFAILLGAVLVGLTDIGTGAAIAIVVVLQLIGLPGVWIFDRRRQVASGVRRSLMVVVASLAVLAAGCGGSDAPETTATVDQIQTFANQQLATRLKANQSADPFTCEEQGGSEWKCTTEVRTTDPKDASADPETESLTVNVTCEAAASCVYQPET